VRFFKLIRVASLSDSTFGVLIDDDVPFCVTVERPWLDNERGKSCIPDGAYVCKRIDSPKFGDTFEVQKVKGRSHILFHKGNISDDSHGCIIIGEQFGNPVLGEKALFSSGVAFKEFKWRTKDKNFFTLKIETHRTEI